LRRGRSGRAEVFRQLDTGSDEVGGRKLYPRGASDSNGFFGGGAHHQACQFVLGSAAVCEKQLDIGF